MLFLGCIHLPAAMLLPEVSHARQVLVVKTQASVSLQPQSELWC